MGNTKKSFSQGNHHWSISDYCFELEEHLFWRQILQLKSTGSFGTPFFSSKQKVFSRLWKKICFHFSEKQCNHLIFKYLPNVAKLLKTGRDFSLLTGGDFLNFQNTSKIWEFNRKLHPLSHIQGTSISPLFGIMIFCGQTEVKITSSLLF